MAFLPDNFLPTSSQANSNAPRIWTYKTDDPILDVIAEDYFLARKSQIKAGDLIYLDTQDGSSIGRFVSSGSSFAIFVDVASFNPTTEINLERLVDGVSPLASQEPSGTGEANQIQITLKNFWIFILMSFHICPLDIWFLYI